MGEIDKLIQAFRYSHPCITYEDDCRLCAEAHPRTCRSNQELFKEAADILTRYANTGMTPEEVLELKARMEGLDK